MREESAGRSVGGSASRSASRSVGGSASRSASRSVGGSAGQFARQVAGVGALAEPARLALYLFVAGQPDAVSREQAAQGCALPLHSVKFHLDRLVDEGLLDVEFRRLSGRTGPGAGRPSKLYRRSARQVSVSLPERRYDLAGEVLAAAIERSTREGVAVADAVAEAAEMEGRRIAAEGVPEDPEDADAAAGDAAAGDAYAGDAAAAAGDAYAADAGAVSEMARTARVLGRHGYEPRTTGGTVCLANCPFDSLAREHTRLVCTMNLALVGGVLDALGCHKLEAVLDPEPGLCCVKVMPRDRA